MQIQQRQHLGHLRRLARPCRQDRRGKPLPLTGIGVDPAVVDPRRGHADRTGGGQDFTLAVVAVAHHQTPTILVEMIGQLLHIGGDLGLQCGSQHLPGTVADDLVQQRPTSSGVFIG
jgi:hypothetical protein